MKKILNWTFGGFFRAFGRILCFLVFGGLIAYLIASNDFKLPDILTFGILRVKADTVNYTYKQYRVQYYSLGQGTTAWNSWTNFGTSSPFSDGYGVSSLAVRFGQSNDFTTGNTYRIVIDSGFSPQSERQYISYSGSSCYGSSSTSSWSNVEIADCQYVGMADIPNSVHRKFVFDVTPSINYKGIQININFSGTAEIRGVNVYNTSTITTGPDITSAIDEQTLIIEDGFTDITNIINQNNEELINAITDSNQVCEVYDKNSIEKNNYLILNSNGTEAQDHNWGITEYIKISNKDKLSLIETITYGYMCFYNINKQLISCINQNGTNIGQITIPNNASFFRGSINKQLNKPQFKLCKNGNQAVSDELHGIGKGIHDNDTTEATSEASNFFNSFSTNTHGLTSIITAPLNAITSLNSSTCTPLHLPIPYLENKYIDLPCMRAIYDQNFGGFMNLYDTIIFGIVSYWIIVRIFGLVKDFKNPEHDEIEVVDL